MAIAAHKRGSGMIIGDQTGVGKGCVSGGMLKYAENKGMIPFFITENANLFADIYRDLEDIGMDTEKRPFVALCTNNTSGKGSRIVLSRGRVMQNTTKDAEQLQAKRLFFLRPRPIRVLVEV